MSATESVVESIVNTCNELRKELKGVEDVLRALMQHPEMPGKEGEAFPGQAGEMRAQTMLAVRHIEDARMRIGKVLQYADDGISILDKLGSG